MRSYELSKSKKKKLAKARRKEEKEWASKAGPVIVTKIAKEGDEQ